MGAELARDKGDSTYEFLNSGMNHSLLRGLLNWNTITALLDYLENNSPG